MFIISLLIDMRHPEGMAPLPFLFHRCERLYAAMRFHGGGNYSTVLKFVMFLGNIKCGIMAGSGGWEL